MVVVLHCDKEKKGGLCFGYRHLDMTRELSAFDSRLGKEEVGLNAAPSPTVIEFGQQRLNTSPRNCRAAGAIFQITVPALC